MRNRTKRCSSPCTKSFATTIPFTCLNLAKYGKIEWKDAVKLAKALDKNEILQSVAFRLYENSIDSEGTIPFTQFLMSSPSIQTLILSGNGSAEYDHATTIVIEALSHSKSLRSRKRCHKKTGSPRRASRFDSIAYYRAQFYRKRRFGKYHGKCPSSS
jgi:hypothetical protein